MSYGKRTCLQCGQEFEATYAAQLCCSLTCKKRRRQDGKNAHSKRRREAHRATVEKLQELLDSAQKDAAESTEALTAALLMHRTERRRLQAATKRLALRKRFLEGRCKELLEQVAKQGEEINVLRGRLEKYAKMDAFMRGEAAKEKEEPVAAPMKQTKAAEKKLEAKRAAGKQKVKDTTVIPHEEMNEILRAETSAKKRNVSAASVEQKKALDDKLKTSMEQIRKEMQECPRMSLRALKLPCGEHLVCYAPARCAKAPQGLTRWLG